MGRALRTEPIRAIFKVSFKDRLQDQQGRHLHYSVTHRRDAQRPQLPIGFRYINALYRLRLVGLGAQRFLNLLQKSGYPGGGGFDLLDRHPIHSRRSVIGTHLPPCRLQHIHAIDPVVQSIKPELRFLLGLVAQLLPQQRDFLRQPFSIASSSRLPFFRSGNLFQAVLLPSCSGSFTARPLGSLLITGVLRYYGPLRLPLRAGLRYSFRSTVKSDWFPLPLHGSPKFLFVCPCALSPSTPEDPIGAGACCFPLGFRLPLIRQSGRLRFSVTRPIRVHFTLRLTGSPHEASPEIGRASCRERVESE